MTETSVTKLQGHQIELPGGRHVFYAEHDQVHYLRFRNSEATETKFTLSEDAVEALIELLTHPGERHRWVLYIHNDGVPRDVYTWKRLDDNIGDIHAQ